MRYPIRKLSPKGRFRWRINNANQATTRTNAVKNKASKIPNSSEIETIGGRRIILIKTTAVRVSNRKISALETNERLLKKGESEGKRSRPMTERALATASALLHDRKVERIPLSDIF